MIDILEIRDRSLKLIGVIDNATSIIWVTEYYGAGHLEIYAPMTDNTIELLKKGNYVVRRDEVQAAIIEAVSYNESTETGMMIIARGRMLKSILDRRLAYKLKDSHHIKPVRVTGYVRNVQKVVREQAGTLAGAARIIPKLAIGSNGGITKKIETDTELEGESSRQSSYKNLLTFTDSILQEYECGALMRLSITETDKSLVYDLYEGKDRTVNNTDGNKPVIFSQNFDNLLSATFDTDETFYKNYALIGGEGEGENRFFAEFAETEATGLDRRETFVNALDVPQTYTDDQEQEQTYTDEEYTALLVGQAQTELKELVTTEKMEAELNLIYSPFKLREDFSLGDKVTIQDNRLNLYMDVRILKITEVQDANGYMASLEYGN